MNLWNRAILALLSVPALVTTQLSAQNRAPTYEEAQEALRLSAEELRDKYKEYTFEQFVDEVVYKEPFEDGVYIVNGDTPIANEKLLREFFDQNVKIEPPPPTDDVAEFIISVVGGLDAVWSDTEKRSLSYCVSNTFGPRYNKVVADVEAATAAWETVAAVDFTHVAAEDGRCNASNGRVVFDVRPVQVNRAYLARAFFPNYPRSQRNVLIDESALTLASGQNLQLVGVLRHELGHTIGARHEHTRPDSGACFEDANWRPMTTYDPFSVMHYPQCRGRGDWSLTLTGRDKNGAACVYGPAPGFVIDGTICTPVGGTANEPQTHEFDNQTVAHGQEHRYDDLSVVPNTPFIVVMEGVGPMPGDPDLYLKFNGTPAPQLEFDCRPYLTGADETCSVDVPADAQIARIMVHGYAAGNYKLTVTHTSP